MNARVLVMTPRTDSPVLSDEALVAACAIGDGAALAMLFERHSPAIYRYISRMIAPDTTEVDDLAQAVFIEVWRVARKFRGASSPRVWMFGIAHNLTRTAMRGRRRRVSAFERLGNVDPPVSRAIDQEIADRRFIGALADAMELLSEGQRGAFVLCELEELTGAEAAKVLDARPGTVGRWLSEARQILRARLEDSR